MQKTFTLHIQMSTSYTINAYMTRTSLLFNDNSVHYFLDNDLPSIHHMIKHANYNGHHVDTHEINALLEKQLQQLVESRDLMIRSKVKCRKCNRNVVSRAVECSLCKLWIHYKCEGLPQSEINKIELDKKRIYICTPCKDSAH